MIRLSKLIILVYSSKEKKILNGLNYMIPNVISKAHISKCMALLPVKFPTPINPNYIN